MDKVLPAVLPLVVNKVLLDVAPLVVDKVLSDVVHLVVDKVPFAVVLLEELLQWEQVACLVHLVNVQQEEGLNLRH